MSTAFLSLWLVYLSSETDILLQPGRSGHFRLMWSVFEASVVTVPYFPWLVGFGRFLQQKQWFSVRFSESGERRFHCLMMLHVKWWQQTLRVMLTTALLPYNTVQYSKNRHRFYPCGLTVESAVSVAYLLVYSVMTVGMISTDWPPMAVPCWTMATVRTDKEMAGRRSKRPVSGVPAVLSLHGVSESHGGW